jgi:D-xylose transport system ATP-binding protein
VSARVILEAEGIVKRYGPVTALDGVNFNLRAGEVHALCGENGAGKSTLIKTLGGLIPAKEFEGTLKVDGKPVQFRSIHDAAAAGIAVTHQELALVPEMTVAENVFLGREPTRGGLVDWFAITQRSQALLKRFGLNIDPETRVDQLGVGHLQLVEIVRALSKDSRILVLDEPTASLNEQEVATLMEIVDELRKSGVACVFVSHRIDEVSRLCDRVTVLRDGKSIVTVDRASATPREIIRHMVGRPIEDVFPARQVKAGASLLSVKNLTVARPDGSVALQDISFQLRAGEILGIGGLMGAGRTELLLHLFGAWGKRLSGEVWLEGQPLGEAPPHDAIARGLALVSEDRKRYGLVFERSIGFNLSLSSLLQLSRHGLLDAPREEVMNRTMYDALGIKARDVDDNVSTLSGGNQQKVVLGRALMTGPKVIFLDEPTRGIDVGAKLEVYRLMNRLVSEGKGIVLVSSEMPELLGMCDGILVLQGRRVGGRFGKTVSQEALLAAALDTKSP